MSAMVVVGAVWLALAVGLALVLARGIRLADEEQATMRTDSNFAVDGDPFAAPLPDAPIFAAAGTGGSVLLTRTRHAFDGD